uniref:Odorant receptor 5 n=1 Tax=Sclerodermus sp. MQW-2015 TaxID=1729718 RepID=A0A0N7FD64_9HYME|nr:odorant receptor 5 [Sclerodermus sp. MQW-2015]
MVFVLVTSFMSQILDTFLPLNESRPHQFPFEFEVFVDKQKHFILIILMFHTMAVVYVMFAVANETMFMVHMDHVLGMFAVLGYGINVNRGKRSTNFLKFSSFLIRHRLEHALPNDVESLKNKESVINLKYYHSIILCIKRHQKASEYAAILESYYAPCLIVSITMSILILSPAFVQLSEIQLMKPQDVFEAVFVVCFWFVHNYMGQRLIDLSSETATKVYFSQWYLCSQRLQKMLPMIMSQCEKPCQISVYDLYISSLYCFRQVMQMGISYCTVIKQLR